MKGLISASVTHFLLADNTCDVLSQAQMELAVKDIEMAWSVFFDIVVH